MSRHKTVTAWALVLTTFLWLFAGQARGGPASIWPSLVALALAFITREIYSSLFLGAFVGAVLLADGNIATAFISLFADHLIPPLTDRWNVCALLFSLMMGGFVELLGRIGGLQALASRALGRGDSHRRAGLGVFAMGWVVFFDGLASSMLVGKTMRPIADRAGMSREKLAFVVDSTSSPIAAFALISTWIAFELTMIQNGLALYGETAFGDAQAFAQFSSYQILVETLPYRFYNYFLLLIVLLTVWLRRDIGPMRRAEARVVRQRLEEDPQPLTTSPNDDGRRVVFTLIPLGLLIVSVFGGLYVNGLSKLEAASGGSGLQRAIQAFGQADADVVFVTATGFASVVALFILHFMSPASGTAGSSGGERPTMVFFEGMRGMFLPVLILVFAFTLTSVIQALGTAEFLAGVMDGNFPVSALPAVVFLLAAVMSFSVGSSWGTMAMLTPLCIPIVGALTGLESGVAPGPIVIATIGAVLAGAVFGDHCSPISDTTIVSAFASGCDAIEHVRTQLPYALIGGGLAVTVGYLPAGLGASPFLLLVVGAAACWAVIRFVGQRPPTSRDGAASPAL
jgi:Na+/H+ antiporter NhaC